MIIRKKRYFVVLNVLGPAISHALLPEVQWFVEAVVQESVVQGVWGLVGFGPRFRDPVIPQ